MLAILPAISYGALSALLLRRGLGWRQAVLFASIPCALFIALDTELLSVFHLLTGAGAALSWMTFAGGVLFLLLKDRQTPAAHVDLDKQSLAEKDQTPTYRPWLYGIVTLVALTGLTALICAPNNWDAMEYHLPRVFEWINNASVHLYPTINRQQLDMPPWAEYAMLHADLLYGGDRLVNLIQWLSYLGCAIGVSLIAKELGGGKFVQMFAALLCATIPSGVLGATGPKNDCVLALWITLSAYLLLMWRRDQSWLRTIALGSTLGLSVFTKGNAFAFLPGVVLASFVIWNPSARRMFLLRLPILAAMCLMLTTPFWFRNYTFSGSVFGLPYFEGEGPVETRMFQNAHISPSETAANLIRNVALHVGTPSTKLNSLLTRVFSRTIRMLGVDPNDPGQLVASQFGFVPQFQIPFGWRSESFAGEPLHLCAMGLACLLYLFNYRRSDHVVGWYGASVLVGFVLFAALLRWGVWNARYHFPLFVLATPFIALVLIQRLPISMIKALSYVFLVASLPLAVLNESRPLLTKSGFRGGILAVPREQTYFFDEHRQMADAFIDAARFVSHQTCRNIGLDANLLRFEYPMMALLTEDHLPRQVVYTSVQNSTIRFASERQAPCLVVCLGCAHTPQKWHEYGTPSEQVHLFEDVVAVLPIETK